MNPVKRWSYYVKINFTGHNNKHETDTEPKKTGAPNENIVQNHLNIAVLNVF